MADNQRGRSKADGTSIWLKRSGRFTVVDVLFAESRLFYQYFSRFVNHKQINRSDFVLDKKTENIVTNEINRSLFTEVVYNGFPFDRLLLEVEGGF